MADPADSFISWNIVDGVGQLTCSGGYQDLECDFSDLFSQSCECKLV